MHSLLMWYNVMQILDLTDYDNIVDILIVPLIFKLRWALLWHSFNLFLLEILMYTHKKGALMSLEPLARKKKLLCDDLCFFMLPLDRL
jgi:hypothetical protein